MDKMEIPPGVLNPISNTTYNSSPTGPLGGGQIGFNWQTGHLVVGAEADWDWGEPAQRSAESRISLPPALSWLRRLIR